MTNEADGLQLQLGITLKQLTSQLAKAEARMNKTAKKMEDEFNRASGKSVQKMGAINKQADTMFARVSAGAAGAGAAMAKAFAPAAIVAGIASIGGAAMVAVRDVAAIGDAAKRAGLSASAFQEWKYVFDQNRIGIDQGVDGFKELALRADEFIQTGGGAGAEAFQRLGLSASELSEALKDPGALMLDIVDRLGDLDKAGQIRVADEIFGGSAGERFVELIAQGEAGLRRTIDTGREIGVVMDDEMIAKAQELDRRFGQLQARLATMFKTAAVDMADFLAGAPRDLAGLPSPEASANILGEGAAAALRESDDLLQQNLATIGEIMNAFEGVSDDAYAAAGGMLQAANTLSMLGEADAAAVLRAAANEMFGLVEQFTAGTLTAEEFGGQLDLASQSAADAFASLNDVDRVSFGNVISQVGALAGSIAAAVQRAIDLRNALPGNETLAAGGGSIGPSARRGKRAAPPPTAAPTKSLRPQLPSIDGLAPPVSRGGSRGGGGGGGSSRDERAALLEQGQREIDQLQLRIALLGQESQAAASLTAKAELLGLAKRRGLDLDATSIQTGETLRAEIDRQAEAIGRLSQQYDLAADQQAFMADASATLKGGLLDAAMAADNAGDFFKSLADRIKRAALEALLFNEGPFGRAGGGRGLLGGVLGTAFKGLGKLLFNADGNAFSGGRVVPFATGGVVNGPTTFPMRGGTGLMGEAGPEAIMPLTRIGGKLGVAAAGGGGGEIVVHINPSTYFDARVETISGQVSARVVQSAGRAQARALPAMNDRIAARGVAS